MVRSAAHRAMLPRRGDSRADLGDPVVAERFHAAGMAPRGSTPAEFARELAQHRARWTALAREFGAKPPG
jgi:tripartite-type tricarboxylate transporter receptor subunit TctC